MVTKEELIAFEDEVAARFTNKEIRGPVHLSGGNEDALLEIFQKIDREDWVFSTYRNHYHALLHGIPRDWLMERILEDRSMNVMSAKHRFFTSAIVGGTLPIAVGVAMGVKRRSDPEHVWCFIGDMAATTGAFHEAYSYARFNELPITFVIEDNRLSCDTPTGLVWGRAENYEKIMRHEPYIIHYGYTRKYPHAGIGRYVF